MLGVADDRTTLTVCSPTSPSCLDPGLPIHATLHRTELEGSSFKITSRICPRFSLQLTRGLYLPLLKSPSNGTTLQSANHGCPVEVNCSKSCTSRMPALMKSSHAKASGPTSGCTST